jgi:solute carrier family 45, member 1/2/4
MTGGYGAIGVEGNSAQHDLCEWKGEAKIIGPRWSRMHALTIGLLGVQTFWSLEMAYGESFVIIRYTI